MSQYFCIPLAEITVFELTQVKKMVVEDRKDIKLNNSSISYTDKQLHSQFVLFKTVFIYSKALVLIAEVSFLLVIFPYFFKFVIRPFLNLVSLLLYFSFSLIYLSIYFHNKSTGLHFETLMS